MSLEVVLFISVLSAFTVLFLAYLLGKRNGNSIGYDVGRFDGELKGFQEGYEHATLFWKPLYEKAWERVRELESSNALVIDKVLIQTPLTSDQVSKLMQAWDTMSHEDRLTLNEAIKRSGI